MFIGLNEEKKKKNEFSGTFPRSNRYRDRTKEYILYIIREFIAAIDTGGQKKKKKKTDM